MISFIKLTEIDSGEPELIWLNVAHIAYVESSPKGGALIACAHNVSGESGDKYLEVSESVDEVMRLIWKDGLR